MVYLECKSILQIELLWIISFLVSEFHYESVGKVDTF